MRLAHPFNSWSKFMVTRPINADAHRAPYLPNGKAYKRQTWCTGEGRRPASAAAAMTSKVKVARSRDQSEPSWPNAIPVSSEAGGGIPCRPNAAATLLVTVVVRCYKGLSKPTSCHSGQITQNQSSHAGIGRVSKQMIIYPRSTFTHDFAYFRWKATFALYLDAIITVILIINRN